MSGDSVRTSQPRKDLVALFSPALCGGGAERVLVNLACGMTDRGVSVDVVLGCAKGPFLSELPAAVQVVDLNSSRIAYAVVPLARYLRRARPDVLLAFQDHTSVAAITAAFLSRSGTPVFAGVHNTWTKILEDGSCKQRLLAHVVRRAYKHASGVIAVSDGAATAVATCMGLNRPEVQVIYNPVITNDLFAKAEANANHPWLKPNQVPVVLGLGRLTRQKDFGTLVESFAQMRGRCPARLMILGEGEERPALEALIERLGISDDVALPGFVANPYPYLRKASAFVLSSAWEGLPTVLIEALALGVPLVATDCESGPSEILNNGQLGALVPVGDIDAMANAMYRAITTKHSKPGDSSWTKFTVPVATAEYLDILLGSRSLLHAHRRYSSQDSRRIHHLQ